jgi:hypothetical protein
MDVEQRCLGFRRHCLVFDPAIHPFRKNFDAKKMDHQNSGVPEFWQLKWPQIGNIRFAVVKPAGDAGAGTITGLIRPGHPLVKCCHKRTEFRHLRSWRKKEYSFCDARRLRAMGAIAKAGIKSRDCCTRANSELQAAG